VNLKEDVSVKMLIKIEDKLDIRLGHILRGANINWR